MMQGLRQKNIRPVLFWALLAAVVAGRLLLAACQRVFLMVGGASLDDMLMVRAAQALVAGEWLGEWGPYAIAKNLGFSLWLALLHRLGIPMLLGNAALWVAASAFAVRAVRPLFPGNLSRLALFAFFSFQPISFTYFNARTYRDSVFPAFCLLLFAGVVGLALRLGQQRKRGSILMACGAGLGLAGAWLLREDGAVVGLFAVAGLLFVLGFAVFHPAARRRVLKGVCCVVPFVWLAAAILAFSAANYAAYGVFVVNDLTSGSFPAAYGAMVGVSRAESGFTEKTPVSRAALERLLEEVPALAPLAGHLFEGSPAYNGFANSQTGEYGGSFYYGLRVAAYNAGVTPDAVTAQAYWATVENEIGVAVAGGRLLSEGGSRSVVPRFHKAWVLPTARETLYGALHLMLFEDVSAEALVGFGEGEAETMAIAAFLHERTQPEEYIEGTDQLYYNPLRRAVFAGCDVLVLLYAILVWPLFFTALWRTVRCLVAGAGSAFKKRRVPGSLLWAVLTAGLLLSVLARLVVAAYMEVASFGFGTYTMYLSSAMPPLLLFFVLGCSLPVPEVNWRRALLAPHRGRQDLKRWTVVATGLGLLALKLLLASSQSIFLDLVESPIDDTLMVNSAMSISAGNWLGEYGWLTLSKHGFFSLWLALLHLLRIPYLLGGQLLWALGSLAAAVAFTPALKRRWLGLLLFGLLLFNPASTANPEPYGYITRVYRDNIFPALCLLVVAGVVGYALRYRRPLKSSLWWLVLCGFALGAAWLCREDGWWLLPFLLAAVAVTTITLLRAGVRQKLAKVGVLVAPFLLAAAMLVGWAGMNHRYYGRFIISDFSAGEFADAYGAMTRIEHEDWDPKVAVPLDVREALYAHVPSFAALAPYLESADFHNRYGLEYSSGSFYWALREAASLVGHYDTPQASQAYFAGLAAEINALCDSGVLPAGPARSSVNPPIRAEYVAPVTREAFNNLWYVLTFAGTSPGSLLSRDVPWDNAEVEAYLREKALVAAREGSGEPYYTPLEQKAYKALENISGVYRLLTPLLFLLALAGCVGGGARLALRLRQKRKNGWDALVWWVQLGLLLCILLRCFMIAFVSVSSFGIGIYIAYLASVHPLVLLFSFVGSALALRRLRQAVVRRKPVRGGAA